MTVTRYTTTVHVRHTGHAPTTGEVDRALADNLLGMVAGPGYGTAPDDRFVDLDPCSAHADARLPTAAELLDGATVSFDASPLLPDLVENGEAETLFVAAIFERRLAAENVTLAEAAQAVALLRVRDGIPGTRQAEALGVLAEILDAALPPEARG